MQNLTLTIEPHQNAIHGITNIVKPNTFQQVDYIDVPPGATNLTINATNADGTKTPMVFTIKTLVHRVIHLTHSIDQLNLFTLSMARSFYKQVPGDKFFETCDKDFMDKLKDSTENPLDLLRAHQDAASKGTVEPNSSPRSGDPEHLEIPFPEAKKG